MSNSPDSRPGIAPSNLRAQERSGPFHRPSRRQIEAAAALALGIGVSAGLSGGVSHRNVEAQGPDSTSTPAPTYAIDPLAHPTEQLNKRIEFPALINGISEYKSVPTARATRAPVTNTPPPIETAKPDPTATNIPATPTAEASATPEVKEALDIPPHAAVYVNRSFNPHIPHTDYSEPLSLPNPKAVRSSSGHIVGGASIDASGNITAVLAADLAPAQRAKLESAPTFDKPFPPYIVELVEPGKRPLKLYANAASVKPANLESSHAVTATAEVQDLPGRRSASEGALPYPMSLRSVLPQLRKIYGENLPPEVVQRLTEEGVDLKTDTIAATTPIYYIGDDGKSDMRVGNLETDGSYTFERQITAEGTGDFYISFALTDDGSNEISASLRYRATGWTLHFLSTGHVELQTYTALAPDKQTYSPAKVLPFRYKADGSQTVRGKVDSKGLTLSVVSNEGPSSEYIQAYTLPANEFRNIVATYAVPEGSNIFVSGRNIIDLNSDPIEDLDGSDTARIVELRRQINMLGPIPLDRLTRAKPVIQWPDNPAIIFPGHPELNPWLGRNGYYDMTRRRDFSSDESTVDPLYTSMLIQSLYNDGIGIMYGIDTSFMYDGEDAKRPENRISKSSFEARVSNQAAAVRQHPDRNVFKAGFFGASGGIHADIFKYYGTESKALDAIASRTQEIPMVITMPESVAFSEDSFPEDKHSITFLKWVDTLVALRDRKVDVSNVMIPAGLQETTRAKIKKALADVQIYPVFGDSFVGIDDLGESFARVNGGYLELLDQRDSGSTRKSPNEAPFQRIKIEHGQPLSPADKLLKIAREAPYGANEKSPPPTHQE